MKYGWDTEYDRVPLEIGNLARLDSRSRVSHIFSHRVEVSGYKDVTNFINWGVENLGTFCPFEIFFDADRNDRLNVKWLIKTIPGRYTNPWSEFYIKKEDLPLVMLYWQK